MMKKSNGCDVCGDNDTLKSYLRIPKQCQNDPKDLTKKFHRLLQLQGVVELKNFGNICTNCFERINSLFDSLTEMKTMYLKTQNQLKTFLEEDNKKLSAEFRKSWIPNSTEPNEPIQDESGGYRSIEGKYFTDPVIEKVTESGMSKDEYTEPEWLSDVETLSDNLEVKMESDLEIHHSTADENVINITNGVKTDKTKCKNNTRINKRGVAYINASEVHVFLNKSGSYECDLCKISFKWRHTAEHHVRSQHTKEKPFKCPTCKKGFTASHYLNRHVSCVHEKVKFTCQKCGLKFPRRYILAAHEKVHEGPPSLSCPHTKCLKKFYAEHVLKAHLLNSHSAKDLMCDQCGKKFRTSARLMNHRQRHDDKRLKCPHCPKLFSVKTDLFVHMKYHKEALPWRCGACNMFFKTTRGLQNHFAISHGERVSRLELYMIFNSAQRS